VEAEAVNFFVEAEAKNILLLPQHWLKPSFSHCVQNANSVDARPLWTR